MYDVCERFRVSYTFGLSANAVLQRETECLLADAVATYERERQEARQQGPARPAVPSRLFAGFWYQAGTWPCPRYVVAKAEANDRGINRRFVVTNRLGAVVLLGPTYDEYAARGESEITHSHCTSSRRWCGDPAVGYNSGRNAARTGRFVPATSRRIDTRRNRLMSTTSASPIPPRA
jgi:hypothetical protein